MDYKLALSTDEFVTRLQSCIDEFTSEYAFFKTTGFSKGTIKGYLKGSEPGRIKIAKLAQALNISPAWLAFGIGEKRGTLDQGWVPIPELVLKRDATTGQTIPLRGPVFLHVKAEIVAQSFLGVRPDNLVMFRMPDTALRKTIKQDEWVIINLGRADLGESGTYCLAINGTAKIRHVTDVGLKGFSLSTEDGAPPIEIGFGNIGKEVQPIGRVIISACWVESRDQK